MNEPKKHFLAEIEEQILQVWDSEKTFEKSLQNRKDSELFSFYDGPPFANGVPHYGHLEQTTIKDTITRYKTMRGYFVPRRIGWDTHGLPVEYAIEKEHGFRGKQDIIKYGIDKFNEDCRASVFKYKDVWEQMFRRVGRWAEHDKTYATLDDDYIESVWWVFKNLYDKGLVYKAFRSSPYCPRCATPLSNFELNQGYQDDVEDPSLFVKFKLTDEDAYVIGWTTTPWSLPGNAALAVKPDEQYVYVDLDDDEGLSETVVLAKKRLEALCSDNYKITKEVQGQELVGKSYEPPFDMRGLKGLIDGDKLYKIHAADFVSIEDGSGVLHVAPAFGEDDLKLAASGDFPIITTIDENGHVPLGTNLPKEFEGKFFKAADQPIIAHLTHKNLVYAVETIKHTYPFCWRCDTPLLYYATDNWLVRVTDIKNKLVKNNQKINWVPEHIRDGRFGKWLEGARDWGVSRNRFWGAPLPIWVSDDGEVTVIGSIEELKKRAVDPSKVKDLHRPYIDEVEIKTDNDKIAKRIPEVFDCWFESGSMPYAQDHYPFENKESWEKQFPADFIAEAVDQTRGWFYTLHVLGTSLFDKPAFQNVICSGWITAADGEKLSKRKKNYAPMDEVFDLYGVDTMRFFMASSPLMNGEDTRFSVDFLRDVQRNVIMSLNNIFSFYKLYAGVDKWTPKNPLERPKSDNILDKWILARLDETIVEVTENMEAYQLDKGSRPITTLIDDTSNWYVRRSRRRFWKSDNDKDKEQAYATLHYVILRISQLLAPFAPFLPDYIWRELVKGTDLPESVHLSDWPLVGQSHDESPSVNKPDSTSTKLLESMKKVRESIAQGLAQRADAKIKVRQPLSSVACSVDIENPEQFSDILKDELNVKEVVWQKGKLSTKLDTNITDELKAEGVMRELVRSIQNARKKAGLNVDDRIKLRIESESKEITEAVIKFKDTIYAETLAIGELTGADHYSEAIKIEGQEVTISLDKA